MNTNIKNKEQLIPVTNLPFQMSDPNTKGWKYKGLTILQSIDDMHDIQVLLNNLGTKNMPCVNYKHTSISHPSRYPTWEEIKEVKELLHGDVFVFQALVPKHLWVNFHENCFHLWEPLNN